MVDIDESRISALWERLRRRKVVQWTLAYAAAGWGLLQVLAFLGEAFGWNQQIKPLSTLVVPAGLPIAVVLAWYHGDKGEQRVRTMELLLVAGVLLLGVGAIAAYLGAPGPMRQRDSASPSAATAHAPASLGSAPTRVAAVLRLAVLPFISLSPDGANAFFADGLHDEILTGLAQRGGMQVVSRTTMLTYRDSPRPLSAIAADLGATHVLEGSVRREGNHVRLAMQLIEARTDDPLWSETYDRELQSALGLQSEVADAVAEALRLKLTANTATRRTSIPNLPPPMRSERAARSLPHGSDIRRRASAWRSPAATSLSRGVSRLRLPRCFGQRPSCTTTGKWTTLRPSRRVQRAELKFPSVTDLMELRGLLLRRLGRIDESLVVMSALTKAEPASLNYATELVETFSMARRYAEAEATAARLAARFGDQASMHWVRALARAYPGDRPAPLREFIDKYGSGWRRRIASPSNCTSSSSRGVCRSFVGWRTA